METNVNYANVKQWRKNNPDKFREQKKKYRNKNKERINSYYREWYLKKKQLESAGSVV